MKTTLDRLRPGECGCVAGLHLSGGLRQRLLDLGVIEGTQVRCLRLSPTGDPVLYALRGTRLALRRQDGRQIDVEMVPCDV